MGFFGRNKKKNEETDEEKNIKTKKELELEKKREELKERIAKIKETKKSKGVIPIDEGKSDDLVDEKNTDTIDQELIDVVEKPIEQLKPKSIKNVAPKTIIEPVKEDVETVGLPKEIEFKDVSRLSVQELVEEADKLIAYDNKMQEREYYDDVILQMRRELEIFADLLLGNKELLIEIYNTANKRSLEVSKLLLELMQLFFKK